MRIWGTGTLFFMRRDESFTFKHKLYIMKCGPDICFREAYLTQAGNIRELLTALLKHYDCPAKTQAPLE